MFILQWSMRFLCDCDSEDPYFYMISVHTGLRPGSGTDSNVNFVLAGEGGDSGVRLLSDGVEHVSLLLLLFSGPIHGHFVFWSVRPLVHSFVRPSVPLHVKLFGQDSF